MTNAVLNDLRQKLAELESSARSSSGADDVVSTGIDALDSLLPGGGFRRGTLVEWLAESDGAGAVDLAFRTALPWLKDGQMCVVVDERSEFYPPSLAELGIDFGQLLIVRPQAAGTSPAARKHYERAAGFIPAVVPWALEQALRCRGVAVTAGWLGRTSDHILRRLQLAAETGGGLGFLFRPAEVRSAPTWCHLRLLVRAAHVSKRDAAAHVSKRDAAAHVSKRDGAGAAHESKRNIRRIEILYCQGGKTGGTIELDNNDETSDVRVVPPLAFARNARQAT